MTQEAVNHPSHYNKPVLPDSRPALKALGFTDRELDEVECIAAMEDTYGPTFLFWFCVQSMTKYLWRAGKKGDPTQDYEKAKWFCDYALGIECVDVTERIKKRIKQAGKLMP